MNKIITVAIAVFLAVVCRTQAAQLQDSIRVQKWQVGNDLREALLSVPASAKNTPRPVIFVFHGHGGNMKEMFYSHQFQKLWPEAIVVVAQGLKTPGKLVDRAGKRSGWQHVPGEMNDRDIHFFDEMLRSLQKEYQVDNKRIYATGHSNGGSFTYLLLAMRGKVLAAIAPSAGVSFGFESLLLPKPVMHILGQKDKLVKPAWQQMQIAKLLKLNQCSTAAHPYEKNAVIYSSLANYPVVAYSHPGGHIYPKEADEVVIKFFKSMLLK